jgi:hypothetical protein
MTKSLNNPTTKPGLTDDLPDIEFIATATIPDKFAPHDWDCKTRDGVTRLVDNTDIILRRVSSLLNNVEYTNLLDAYIELLDDRNKTKQKLDLALKNARTSSFPSSLISG